jgi:hypothetical protein
VKPGVGRNKLAIRSRLEHALNKSSNGGRVFCSRSPSTSTAPASLDRRSDGVFGGIIYAFNGAIANYEGLILAWDSGA